MKKIFTLIAAFTLSASAFAQVNVTYRVDITNYLAGGATLNAAGIRVGGNFTDNGGTVVAGPVANWSPSDANSAMTNTSGNMWEIVVTYPAASIGLTQQYKFVNGDWGTNEGTDPANTIATGGCGVDDGSGNINRTLVIPQADVTLEYCWDACVACLNSLDENQAIQALLVSPNPTKDIVNFSFDVNGTQDVQVIVYDLTGKVVATQSATNLSGQGNVIEMNIADLNAGSYIYSVNAGEKTSTGKLTKF